METVKQEETTNQAQPEPANDKTFTQAEMNQIVQERLARERAKFEGYDELKAKAAKYDEMEEANKTELQKAQDEAAQLKEKISKMEKAKEISELRTKIATEKGVPVDLLTGETQEACEQQADGILSFAKVQGYPYVKDGGEPHQVNKKTARENFKEWADANL